MRRDDHVGPRPCEKILEQIHERQDVIGMKVGFGLVEQQQVPIMNRGGGLRSEVDHRELAATKPPGLHSVREQDGRTRHGCGLTEEFQHTWTQSGIAFTRSCLCIAIWKEQVLVEGVVSGG